MNRTVAVAPHALAALAFSWGSLDRLHVPADEWAPRLGSLRVRPFQSGLAKTTPGMPLDSQWSEL
jgi:hypothetical protein